MKTIQQAKEFEIELDKEEVKVGVITELPTDPEAKTERRNSAIYRIGKEGTSEQMAG